MAIIKCFSILKFKENKNSRYLTKSIPVKMLLVNRDTFFETFLPLHQR